MKKLAKMFMIPLMAIAMLVGCGVDPALQGGTEPTASSEEIVDEAAALTGTVSTNGSTSMEGVIAALIESFNVNNPDVTITYDATGSGAGITAATEGNTDIGLSSRTLKDTETGLDSAVVALDGIAIVVNTANTVTDLTIEQIASLFNGTITNWSEVGGADAPVAIIGREAGSGTRDGFETIVDVVDTCVYDQELTSTGAVITAVASNEYAIGYASFSAVGDTVNALLVEGIECSEATILDGTYSVQRPFVLVTNASTELSAAAQAFVDYAMSADVKDIIAGAGAVQPQAAASAEPVSGTVSTNGSTSMEGVIAALIESFNINNPDVTITYDATGSGAGITAATEGNTDIGLSSRALKDTETGLNSTVIALDGIAIVVNTANTVTDLTIEQIAGLFNGTITNWSEVGGADAPVAIIGREAGSGTRDGFETIVDVVDTCVYDQELTSTGAVITAVASNEYAIGYASFSAVGDTVNALLVEGIECSEATILDGTYSVQRPFVLVTNASTELSAAAQAFVNYAVSADAAGVISAAGAVQPK